jgi:hypothetical protein
MRRTSVITLGFAFLLGCLTANAVAQYVAPAAHAGVATKYQYYCETASLGFSGTDTGNLAEHANKYGREGWRVSSINISTASIVYLCYERQLP